MKYLLILLSFAFYGAGQAQFPDYYVHLVSGEVILSKAGAKPIAIKQKQLVYKGDVLVLKKGTELTLVDKNAIFWVLNAPGTYKASEIIKVGAKKNNDGLFGKMLSLSFHELFDPNHDFEKFRKENIANVKAGVSRSEGCGNRIFPINGVKTSTSSIIFRWQNTSPSSAYSFSIYDEMGKELAKRNIKDTQLLVNITEMMQGKTGKYFWQVTSTDGDCEDELPISFEILTSVKEKEMTEELIAATNNESLEAQLQQIDKLEKNFFIDVAIARYSALVNANPANTVLRKSYVSFLLKYGFEKEAASAWK